jgi:hypothetical protein
MAELKKSEQDELNELRERVKALEAELKASGEKKEAKAERRGLGDMLEESTDQANRLSMGFLYAGLESMAVAADITKAFIDKTYERNSPEKRDSVLTRMSYLPWDMTEASVDALDKSIDMTDRIVNKFTDKYHEK